MSPGLRKFALTAHITASVGWLGAVAAFLALSLTGLFTRNVDRARSAYVAMEITGWLVIVPLSVASLITGVVQSLGSAWGLVRHYWVIAKLLINVLATLLLLLHMGPVSRMAALASHGALPTGTHEQVRVRLVFDASLALVALVVAVVFSVYKPKGVTAYGRRRLRGEQTTRA